MAVPAGRDSRLRRVGLTTKDDAIFALSSRAVSKPGGENTSEFPAWFHAGVQVFAQPKQGGIVPTD